MKNEQLVLRFYNERFVIDRDYYEGYTDLQQVLIYASIETLKKNWKWLLEGYEGEAYSIRTNSDGYLLCGGSFDPGDIDIIENNLMRHCGVQDKTPEVNVPLMANVSQILKEAERGDDGVLDGICRIARKHNIAISVSTEKDLTTLSVTPLDEE